MIIKTIWIGLTSIQLKKIGKELGFKSLKIHTICQDIDKYINKLSDKVDITKCMKKNMKLHN